MAMSFLGYEGDELDRHEDIYEVFCKLFESLSDDARTSLPGARLGIEADGPCSGSIAMPPG